MISLIGECGKSLNSILVQAHMLAFSPKYQVRLVELDQHRFNYETDAMDAVFHAGQNDVQAVDGCPSVSMGDVIELSYYCEHSETVFYQQVYLITSRGYRQIGPRELIEYLQTDRVARATHYLLTSAQDEVDHMVFWRHGDQIRRSELLGGGYYAAVDHAKHHGKAGEHFTVSSISRVDPNVTTNLLEGVIA